MWRVNAYCIRILFPIDIKKTVHFALQFEFKFECEYSEINMPIWTGTHTHTLFDIKYFFDIASVTSILFFCSWSQVSINKKKLWKISQSGKERIKCKLSHQKDYAKPLKPECPESHRSVFRRGSDKKTQTIGKSTVFWNWVFKNHTKHWISANFN